MGASSYLGADTRGVRAGGLLEEGDVEEEESVDLECIPVGGNAGGDVRDRVGSGARRGRRRRREMGDAGERVDVGEENTEVRAQGLDEVELGGRGEEGEAADERVDAVEDVLFLDAEELPIG